MKKKILSIFLIFFLIFIPIFISKNFFEINVKNYIIFFLLNLLIFEFIFLLLKKKYPYNPVFSVKENSSYYYDAHPYLPYVLKSHAYTADTQPTKYILQNENFYFPKLKTNNLGFLNGKNGSRDVQRRRKNVYTIGCLGNSTTLNYISFQKNNYSYPLVLEKILKQKFKKKKIEVNNFGTGLYNSTEILIRFVIQILDLRPNTIIVYCGHNDHEAYLSNNFKKDYSHFRRNLSENYWRVKIYKFLPKFGLNILNLIYQNLLDLNLRNTLSKFVTKGEINFKINHKDKLHVFERNIQTIVSICKSKGINVILSSYCYYLHPKIKKNKKYLKINKIVEDENRIIKKIAKKNKVIFVDNSLLIKKNNKFFLDNQHFSPLGMQKLAENFSKKIKIL